MKKATLVSVSLFFCFLSKSLFSQYVGINTLNPTKGKLEVYGATGATSAIFGGDGAGISLQRNWPTIGFNQYGSATGARAMTPGNAFIQYLDMNNGSMCLDFFSAATQPNNLLGGQTRRLTIRQNGNVSVLNYDANASLFVGPNNLGLTVARFRGTQYNSVFNDRVVGQSTQHTYINGGKNGSNVIINDQGLGNVLLGGSGTRVGINRDPTSVLDIRQIGGRGLVLVAPNLSYNNWGFTLNHELNESQSDLWVYYNEGYKGNFFSVDGLYYPASDRRVKTDIQVMPPVLKKVLALQPVFYQMKEHNPAQLQSIGFLAQQVKPLFPELVEVIEGDELGYKGITSLHTMSYDGVGPIAIKAIQEQQQKIKSLREKNKVLRLRIEAAEKAMALIQ
jgi:hypothetical protein